MKLVITAAIVLAASSLALTAVAVSPLLHESFPFQKPTRVMIPAKLAAAEEGEQEQSVAPTGLEPSPSAAEPSVTPVVDESAPPVQPKVETKPPVVPDKKPQTPVKQKVIYLTFDDGPGKYTEPLLDILERYQIHGTFFMIGNQLSSHKEAVNQTLETGHYIGLHSMTHNKKKLYNGNDSAKFVEEFTKEQQLFEKLTGTTPKLIRAPYGSKPEIGEKFRGDIAKAGFKMWDWTVDSKDWKYPDSPSSILKEVKRQTHRNTEVILLHEKAQTVKVLPQIIEYLQSKGYAFAVYKPDQHFTVNFGNDPRL
ncbi:polysaccharide deacetylase family protein [Paenibacillus sp. MBLB2552]|uniref:Polysaccharide deacetylase family protein n=1 Tax=Paenibacillus mellifer TaxID=2937794 RepID=A0A9X2BNE6_9BACL|nr:polysaccharide deacetylase family protein [Paenibacillus mellifer]MCK8486769.1 polysaccharide deacetylase family protein [Paenibacillus mellifer]